MLNIVTPIDYRALLRDVQGHVLCECGGIMEALPECEGATWWVCGDCERAIAVVDMEAKR